MEKINSAINGNVVNSQLSPTEIFPKIASSFGAAWLDSTLTFGDRGNKSFIATNPIDDLIWDIPGKIQPNSGRSLFQDGDHLFEKLESYRLDGKVAVGYIGYEGAVNFVGIKSSHDENLIPAARFLIYDEMKSFESSDETVNFSSEISQRQTSDKISKPIQSLNYEIYRLKIDRIKEYISEGDIYQANFTNRFEIKSDADAFQLYLILRSLNPAPYGAYLNFGDYQIISSSPERMFYKNKNQISSSPIKGTIERGSNKIEEAYNINQLLNSKKDRAELLMIVDLIRNDLGKIAETGTVSVDELFKVEVYSSLIHLAADISAKLRSEIKLLDIFKALMPGGSITGTPKKRAIEIIDEQELSARSVYTGCIGYIDKDVADFNIAIRTMLKKDDTFYIHAGGGIVADSEIEAEYNELLLKAKNLFKSLGYVHE